MPDGHEGIEMGASLMLLGKGNSQLHKGDTS